MPSGPSPDSGYVAYGQLDAKKKKVALARAGGRAVHYFWNIQMCGNRVDYISTYGSGIGDPWWAAYEEGRMPEIINLEDER